MVSVSKRGFDRSNKNAKNQEIEAHATTFLSLRGFADRHKEGGWVIWRGEKKDI